MILVMSTTQLSKVDRNRFIQFQRTLYEQGFDYIPKTPEEAEKLGYSIDSVLMLAENQRAETVKLSQDEPTLPDKVYANLRDLITSESGNCKPILIDFKTYPTKMSGRLYMRVFSITENHHFDQVLRNVNATAKGTWTLYHPAVVAWALIYGLCNEAGERIFSEADFSSLSKERLDGKPLDRVFIDICWRQIMTFNDYISTRETLVKN